MTKSYPEACPGRARLAAACVLLMLLSSCATQQQPAPEPDGRDEKIAVLTAELAAAEAKVVTLERQCRALDAQLETAQQRITEQDQQIARLEVQIEQLSDELRAATPADVALLNERLEAARREQQTASDDAARLRGQRDTMQTQLDDTQQALNDLQEQYQAQGDATPLLQPGQDPSLTAASQVLVDLDAEAPVIKTVFYGTTRARLIRGTSDYLMPFFVIALVAILFLAVRYTIKKIIKDKYQRRGLMLAWLIFGIAIVGLTVKAIADTLQMRADDRTLLVQYGNDWRKAAPGEPAYERGFVDVSIPPSRQVGEVNRPQLTRFEFVADPAKHFVLAGVRSSDKAGFYADLNEVIAEATGKDMFVFVHGFHNTFQDAAFRTAQIAHDMQFPGAPVFFSWPSQGTVLDYTTDAENVDDSIDHLRDFLQELHTESGAERIHLLAHSMGSRALSNAILRLDEPYRSGEKFNELVFAAPDIKATRLAQMVPEFGPAVSRVTLYASAHDSALQVSRALQGQAEDYQRAGETWPRPLVVPPMDTIDVSGVTTGHSYVSNSGHILSDLAELLLSNRELDEGIAVRVPVTGDNGYWVLKAP